MSQTFMYDAGQPYGLAGTAIAPVAREKTPKIRSDQAMDNTLRQFIQIENQLQGLISENSRTDHQSTE